MNYSVQLFKLSCSLMLFVALFLGCRKSDEAPGDPGDPGDSTNFNADLISDHLLLTNASKKPGTIPPGPSGSSLKLSFRDTLYLFDEIKRPIKFLHLDSSKNISGLYIQVSASSNGGAASHYYDVPEVEDVADSDTVSVIMVGIDPDGLTFPQIVHITIVPYDGNKRPIDKVTRPVKIDRPKKDSPAGGSCSIVLSPTDYWDWDMSFTLGDGNTPAFYNDPFIIHSAEGQDIEGSCCFGISAYPEYCPGKREHNQQLHFDTYYQIKFETFRFYDNQVFLRQTLEDSPIPLPAESNFCGGGSGKVRASLKHTIYEGDWSIVATRFPPNPPGWLKNDSQTLELRTTSTSGAGYGNPGGIIHQIDCQLGYLVLVQADREGGSRHLIKIYSRRRSGDAVWY